MKEFSWETYKTEKCNDENCVHNQSFQPPNMFSMTFQCNKFHGSQDKRRILVMKDKNKLSYSRLYVRDNDKEDCKHCNNLVEFLYHPQNYKSKECPSVSSATPCIYEQQCPYYHTAQEKTDWQNDSRAGKFRTAPKEKFTQSLLDDFNNIQSSNRQLEKLFEQMMALNLISKKNESMDKISTINQKEIFNSESNEQQILKEKDSKTQTSNNYISNIPINAAPPPQLENSRNKLPQTALVQDEQILLPPVYDGNQNMNSKFLNKLQQLEQVSNQFNNKSNNINGDNNFINNNADFSLNNDSIVSVLGDSIQSGYSSILNISELPNQIKLDNSVFMQLAGPIDEYSQIFHHANDQSFDSEHQVQMNKNVSRMTDLSSNDDYLKKNNFKKKFNYYYGNNIGFCASVDVEFKNYQKLTTCKVQKDMNASLRLQEYGQYICSFLNHKGGIIHIGVRDDGYIDGIALNQKQKDWFSVHIDTITSQIEPKLVVGEVRIDFIDVQGKPPSKEGKFYVIQLSVVKTNYSDIYFFENKAYIKRSSTITKMSMAEIKQLKLKQVGRQQLFLQKVRVNCKAQKVGKIKIELHYQARKF